MMMLRNSILLIVCFLELSSSFYHIHGIRSRIGVWKRLLSTRSSSSSYEKTTTSKSSSSTQSLAKVTKKIAASVYGRNQSRTKLESSVGLSVHSEICSQLSGNARQNVPALKAFLVENDSYLLFVNGHALMQRCARAKIPIESVIALPRLLEVLKYRAPSEYTTFQISSFLYGLRSLFITSTVLTKDKLDILNFGNEILLKHDNGSMFTAQEVSNSFYGLQYLNADNPTTCLLISRMVDVMKSSTPNFSCHEISNSLYGFRRMTADTMEVQKALTMLVYQFALSANAESSLREQSFGSSFNGLQMMNCDKQSVRNLLVLLNHLLIKSNFTSAQPTTIASVFSGLRSMTTWCEELGTLVETLASMLYKLNTTLTNDTVGQVLGGLRHFSDTQLPTRKLLAAIARSIQRSDIKFTPESLSYCMLGLKSMTGVSIEYTQLIEAINARLALSHASDASVAATNGVKLTSTEISRIFYGLQETSLYKKPALQSLLSVVHEWLSASDETVFSGRDVGMTLYGFKSQSYKERIPLVISLLATLTNKVSPAPSDKPRPNTFYFNAQSASMAFMGLQSLNGSTAVYAIIDAIIPRIAELDQRGASTILFSLRHLSSSHPTTCKLIAKLVPLMRSVHHLTSQEIANSLWGLQGMDGRVTEVAQLFEIVAALLEEIPSTVTFSGPEISMAISGLQSCGDECPAVIKILGLLADRLESCSDKLRSFEIANILFGLQGMSGEHDACRAVLVALLPKMKECIAPFSARDIAFSMVGLSTMQPSAVTFSEIWLVLEELNLKFSQSEIKGATQLDFSVFGKGIKLKSNAVE